MVSLCSKEICKKRRSLNRLRQRGCRITKQRMLLLDIILEEECSSCKEIYYKASKIDSSIGSATVYRMINMLEEIGAINRRNMYKVSCTECEEAMDELPGGTSRSACTIEFDDNSSIVLHKRRGIRSYRQGFPYVVTKISRRFAVSIRHKLVWLN